MTTAVILAAGAGSRLGELGKRHSKAMLPVAGKPLVGWVIERLRAAGVARWVVVGHESDQALAAYVATTQNAELAVQRERRGIADALALALPALADEPAYLACACDSLFEVSDLAELIGLGRARAGAAIVGVLEMGVDATPTRSAVRVAGDKVIEIVEKPAPGTVDTGLVSMPLYWLPAAFAPHLTAPQTSAESYVSTALAAYVAAGGELLAFPVQRRLEITTPEDIAAVERALV